MGTANKVVINTENGPETLIDLTGDSVTPDTLAKGTTAHDASGKAITGTLEGLDGLCIFTYNGSDKPTGGVITVPTESITVPKGYKLKVGDLVICGGLVYAVTEPNAPGDGGSVVELGYQAIDLRGATPIKGKDYFTEADKADIVDDVISELSNSEIPSYWKNALDEGTEVINAAIEAAGRNKSAFLFYTDAHWGYGSGMSPKLLKYLGKHTAINKTIFGGDFGNTYEHPDTGKTMDDWMEVMREWKLAVRDIPNHHSVVGNHDKDVTAINNDKALYGFLFAPEESNDIVRGGDFFYYIDDKNEKTRYFYLNTGLCNFSDEQCAFLIEGLTSVPSGWHIVAVSHIWFVYDDTSTPTIGSVPTNIQKVIDLFDAYNARGKGSVTIDSTAYSYDFSACEGWVEFCIGGHTHVDYHFTSAYGIPIILCQTDSRHLRGGEYTYTEGTTTEAAVSGVVADYDAKKISIVRIGRGESKEIAITNYIVTYTNVLSIAIGTDGQPFQNGKGYAENSRMGSGGLYIGTAPGMCCTGFILIDPTVDQVIRLKNVTMKTDSANKNNIAIACWSESFARLTFLNIQNFIDSSRFNLVLDGTNITQITFPKSDIPSGSKYIALCCDDINDASIITINEPIE